MAGELPKDATLYDIGANVGMYSVYAATVRAVNVLALSRNRKFCAVK